MPIRVPNPELIDGQSIISRQLSLLCMCGIDEVIVTTGYYDKVLKNYCKSLNLPIKYTFVKNHIYNKTNYIYSIYCAKDFLVNEDIILMHGDLVFESEVLKAVISNKNSCMTVSSTLPLPEKDFKAVIGENSIKKIGVEFFNGALSAQPLYKLKATDWNIWLQKIVEFCENDNRKCYAENAFNEVSEECKIYILDVKEKLCAEVDTPMDLEVVNNKIKELKGD